MPSNKFVLYKIIKTLSFKYYQNNDFESLLNQKLNFMKLSKNT